MIGQVQLVDVVDPDRAVADVTAAKAEALAAAAALAPRLCERGGGPVDLKTRVLSRPGQPDGGMLVVHLLIDCQDAMGANLVNTVAEGVAEKIAQVARARVGLRILSNLSDERIVQVTCQVPDAALVAPAEGAAIAAAGADPGTASTAEAIRDGAAVRAAIVAASRFAELDPYRAATHNKGIMNGVDAVLIATGNDWRSVEAGAHAYAARDGAYRPLATWRSEPGQLAGELVLPLAVGTVGGALQIHPGARLALALLGARSSATLAAIAASTGLATNLAALRALATDGIQRGHMLLHARLVARAVGATGDLVEEVAAALAAAGDVKPDRARAILAALAPSPHAPSKELP
jgi:hydroxymethylglutaryl-CoA reductase